MKMACMPSILFLWVIVVISALSILQGCMAEEEVVSSSSNGYLTGEIFNEEKLDVIPSAPVMTTQEVIPENCMFPECCCPKVVPPIPKYVINTDDTSCRLEERCCC